jgi:hypothetical protein
MGLGLMVASLVSPLVGCAKDEFADRTARLDLNGTTVALDLESCGLDGETLFLVGRSSSGHVVQAVVALADDGTTGVVGGTGVSVDLDERAYEAFGADAWGRRGEAGEPPGEVGWARLRGSRIQVAGELDEVDGPPVPFTLDARCDDRDPDG